MIDGCEPHSGDNCAKIEFNTMERQNCNTFTMSIILLRGFSQSGKDFVGNELCETYGYKCFAISDALKHTVAEIYNCSFGQLDQERNLEICEHDSLKRTYRQILLDEEKRLRSMDPDIFVKQCCSNIQKVNFRWPPEYIVITDWKYPNELDYIKATFPRYKITPVHIQRDGQSKSPLNDISEYQLMDRTGDYVLVNRMNATIYREISTFIRVIHEIL
jgi:hypothetical protein